MRTDRATARLFLVLWTLAAMSAGAQEPEQSEQESGSSSRSWYLYGGTLGDIDRLAAPHPDLPGFPGGLESILELTSTDVRTSLLAGLGGTWCLGRRFALDFGLEAGPGTLEYLYAGDSPPIDLPGGFLDGPVEGLLETDVDVLAGNLTGRVYLPGARRVRPWLAAGLRFYVLRPDPGRFTLSPLRPGGGTYTSETAVELSDVEELDLHAGLGVDFELTDHLDVSLSGDQGLDLGWSAGLRLVLKLGPRACGCSRENGSRGDDPLDDDDDDEDEDDEICGPFLPGEAPLPRIETPVMMARRPLGVDPAALPTGARAHFPAFDGDRFFVGFPESRPRSEGLAGEVVAPILRAIGFEAGPAALREPPIGGVAVPGSDFAILAEAVAYESASAPGALGPGAAAMIEVLTGRAAPDSAVQVTLEDGLGMSFEELVADVTQSEILYPFQQLHDGTPIEHTLLLASGRPDGSLRSVRGTLVNHYVVTNHPAAGDPVAAADKAMKKEFPGIVRVDLPAAGEGPVLVLLPYGSTPDGFIRLRYAYRMILVARFCKQEVPFLLWLDAEDATLLKIEPLVSDAASEKEAQEEQEEPKKPIGARAAVFNRDPGIGTTKTFLYIDPAKDGEYTLQNAEGLNRVDFQDNGFDDLDLAVAEGEEGGSEEAASFDQYPINDDEGALCGEGTNKGFQQVHFFASLTRYRRYSMALGIDPVFSLSWKPGVESPRAGCNAWSNMSFGACRGYYDAACPRFSDGTDSLENCMNFAHDNTVIAHELGHNITFELTNRRPFDWCGSADCAIPVGWRSLHELADFWAVHFESTDCIAGWTCKNVGGVDVSLGCRSHSEGSGLPRLHEVSVPFDPGTSGDHFPEHRRLAVGDYADMQMATAALWQLRLGMRSKNATAGLLPFSARFARALRNTGFLGFTPEADDLGIYQYLYDLEVELMDQWASSMDPTTQKVTAAFARTGLFPVPYACLDGDPSSADPGSCPSGESGGEAVIDLDDNDPDDDFEIRGVRQREVDFLEIDGPPPTFHVWTGPLYRFDSEGRATLDRPAPCNRRYRVDVATDPSFPPAATVDSGWLEVGDDPASPPACYDAWTPSVDPWNELRRGGSGTRIYYRVTTQDAGGKNERVSTAPGNGLWTVPPPYAVLTEKGTSFR